MNPEALSQLTPEEKRALLRRLLTERASASPGDYPLAHAQRALWFLQRLLPETCAYNVAFAARVYPSLDLDAFRTALDQLVAQHAALRTVFPERDGQPVQRILPTAGVRLRIVDASDMSDAELHASVCADYRRPFSLDDPLMVVCVYRRPGQDVLLINVHHLIFDAWSLQVLFADLRTLYDAALHRAHSGLPPQPAQYADFVTWQNDVLAGEREQELWDYWATTLADDPPPLAIPTSYPRTPTLALRGANVPFFLNSYVSEALHALAKHQNTTLYSVMLAAMQVLLYQFSGEPDITIGTPVSLRTRSEWSNVVGYFINMLPMRGTVDASSSFIDRLARARQTILGALSHQDFPFSLMVDRLKVRRDPNRSPVFQAMLNVIASPRTSDLSRLFSECQHDPVAFGDSNLVSYPIPQQEGQFEIVIEITDSDGALRGNLKYQSDLYSHELAERMTASFTAILEAVAQNPDMRVDELTRLDRDTFHV